jgi:hypothetical protein
VGLNCSREFDASELIDAPTDSGAGITRILWEEVTDGGAVWYSAAVLPFCMSAMEADGMLGGLNCSFVSLYKERGTFDTVGTHCGLGGREC